MPASSNSVAFISVIPRMLASRLMVSRGLISTLPRLPITTMRPLRARTVRSLPRFTLASISRITSTPRPISAHGIPWIDLDAAAAPDHHDAAIASQNREVLAQVYIGQHLKDHIHASPVRQLFKLAEVVSCAVIQNMMRSLLHHQISAAISARGADHFHARRARQLHGSNTNPSAGSVDQNRFSWQGPGAMK